MDQNGPWLERNNILPDRLAKGEHRPPITDLVFNDMGSQLLYLYQGGTLYESFQYLYGDSSRLGRMFPNSCTVVFSDTLTLSFSIGIPFLGTHDTYDVPPDRQMCHWQYLSFGIATHPQKNLTIACLLRSDAHCQASNCHHILNRERGRRLAHWTVAARLWGYPTPTSSLGCIVAASEKGTRLAVANWNLIYIWVLNPAELIDFNVTGFYPESWISEDSGAIELRPIVLRLDAVCFQMRFTDKENELLALTDRGLFRWDLDPHGTGARIVYNLGTATSINHNEQV
jgi:hypothetical protein